MTMTQHEIDEIVKIARMVNKLTTAHNEDFHRIYTDNPRVPILLINKNGKISTTKK